jgi:protein-L-isoaspartate(D-aspartate) O-methyltransferase
MMDDHVLRQKMIEEQIKRRGVKDAVTLDAMSVVPRHEFVPTLLQVSAYEDTPLPIGLGQTISQPYIVALMTQSAELKPDDSVLEIGTGSGYAAAILSRIVKKVFTIERIEDLAQRAKAAYKRLGYDNIEVKSGDGTRGWADKGPFDAILVTAGAPIIPNSLKEQLKPGGRLIIPVGDAFSQRLLRIRKLEDNTFVEETVEYVRFVPLIGEEGWRE